MRRQSDYVCPLCCEELDISDREFYPCKCGYQVCMWCWHRIRESESGLCPACRTPYGEDPHQFSAVDVEDVLKANKEREVAAKRERDKQRQGNNNVEVLEDDVHAALPVPQDRMQLSNMRVIRRNLVYAVGLPLQIATEDILKRAEYFGQYGKISKIVINKTQTLGTDPRRATASAYITFVHKEDTLACILALDGFHLENRNIRASYGTSKYCSAFIKNVRCNNPECTYLHEMGAGEDTFTKQEIQAGYVTSGRDVLARQQQIVAEQLRLGAVGGKPRKRIGGGGPSGTGKPSPNPVFPPPEYDEPAKSAVPSIPPMAGVAGRSLTTGGIHNAINSSNMPTNKLGRATSMSSPASAAQKSPTLGAAAPPLSLAAAPKKAQTIPGTTAASVVAGVARPNKVDTPESHTTLTPLTPLKRNSKASRSAAGAPPQPVDEGKVGSLRNGSSKKSLGLPSFPTSADAGGTTAINSTIGGELIGQSILRPRNLPQAAGIRASGPLPSSTELVAPVAALGGQAFRLAERESSRASALGGEIFTGRLPNSSAIGSNKDKWNSNSAFDGPSFGGGAVGGDLWSNNIPAPPRLNDEPSAVGGSIIGGPTSSTNSAGNSSSSALASLLGISLPTGSGSLASSGDFWSAPGPSALSALNNTAKPMNDVMGGQSQNIGGNALIGGIPIGGSQVGNIGAIGGSSKSDIALLQSLLPGVHVTAGHDDFFGGGSGWSNAVPNGANQHMAPVGSTGLNGAIGGIPNASPQNQRRGQGIW